MFKSQNTNHKSQTNHNAKIQNSKGFLRFVICILFIVCNLVFGNWNFSFAQHKIVAIVNNDIITQKDLNDFVNFMRIQLRQDYSGKELESKIQSMKLDLIDRLIEDRLILQEASRLGVIVDENRITAKINEIRQNYRSEQEYQDALRQQGLVQADLENKIREQYLMYNVIDYRIRSKVTVSPIEVTEYYENNPSKIGEQREFVSISVNNRDMALEIYDKLKQGEVFEEVAKAYLLPINKLSVTETGQLKKDIEEIIFALKKNEYSKPVEIDNNYYIFKLADIIPPRQLTLSEAQDKIYAYLFNKKMEEEMAVWLTGLKKKSYIEIFQE